MKALARCFWQTLRRIAGETETVVLLLAASILYALFYPTPYMRQVLRDLPVVVVDRDHSALSRQLTRWVDASEAASVTARSNDLDAAQDSVRAGAAGAVLLIPKDAGSESLLEQWLRWGLAIASRFSGRTNGSSGPPSVMPS